MTVDQIVLPVPGEPGELIAFDDAPTRLEEVEARKAEVVELRYFGRLSEEAAQVLRVSPNTIVRDRAFAKAWLSREFHGENAD